MLIFLDCIDMIVNKRITCVINNIIHFYAMILSKLNIIDNVQLFKI